MAKHLPFKRKSILYLIGALGLITTSAQSQTDSVTVVSTPAQIMADTASVGALSDLSIEELMNMSVTVSSKKAETIADAPGSITAYSSKDIEKLGYYTLGDLASITSGYSAFKGIGETTFETRGQKADGFDNNKHLVLIDGIPFSNTRANRANAEEDLPLYFAKRVEFLKGPGSALYGISAFSGVINIVSKDLEENGTKVETKISAGSNNFNRRIMSNIYHKSDAGTSRLSLGYYGKDASRAYLGAPNSIPDQNALYYDNSTSLFLNGSHKITEGVLKGLGAGFIYSSKTGGLGDFWMEQQNQTYELNQITFEELTPYLKYQRDLSKKLVFNSYLKGNISNEKAYVGGYMTTFTNGNVSTFSNYNVRVYNGEFLGELKYQLFEKTNIIGGVNIDTRNSTGSPESYAYSIAQTPGISYPLDLSPSTLVSSSRFSTYSAYAQIQQNVNILKGMNITAGGRLDMGRVTSAVDGSLTNQYNQFSPRVAVVQKVTDAFNLKAMYGMALRAPLIKEVGLNEETRTKPDANLVPENIKPETIQSYEVGATYNTSFISTSVTGFQNSTDNVLGKLGSAAVYVNQPGQIRASGIEADLSVIPVKNFKIGGNYAYAKAILPAGTVANQTAITTANVPTTKVNGTATYTLDGRAKISFTLVGRWIDNYTKGERNGVAYNGLLAGNKLFDFNVVAGITKNLGLELQVRNIFNETYRTPTFYAAGQLNIPGAPRSVLVTMSLKF